MKLAWLIFLMVAAFAGLGYVTWRVWHILPVSNRCRRWVAGVMLAAFLCFFLAFWDVTDYMPLWLGTCVYEVGTSSVLMLLYLIMAFVVLDLLRLLHLMPKSWFHDNFILSEGIFAYIACVFFWGYITYRCIDRKQEDVLTGKAVRQDTYNSRIVLVSDLHLGYHIGRSELRKMVDIINDENPDIVLIAGDIIDKSMRPLIEEDMAKELQRIFAPVYACLGNHEYYCGKEKAMQFYRDAGITLLCDSVARKGIICIIGRDDRSNPHRKSLSDIMKEAKVNTRDEVTILLDHQPYNLKEAEDNGIDFQFSGHTHHGQVWPINWITDAMFEDAYGPYQRLHTHYYVTSGMGIWGGKFRLGTRSEYLILTAG